MATKKFDALIDTPCIGYPAVLSIDGQIVRTSTVVDILFGKFGYIIRTKNTLYVTA